MSSSRKRLLIINTFAVLAGRFGTKLLALLVIPYLFHYLGNERWAVYGMALTVMFLATLADPGLRYGYIKVFSEYLTARRGADVRRMIVGGFVFYAVMGLIGWGIAWWGIEWILNLAGVEQAVRSEARFFFLATLGYLALMETGAVFLSLLLAMQRMTLANTLSFLGSAAHYVGVITVIWFDLGLRGLGWMFLAAALIQGLLYLGAMPFALSRIPDGKPPVPLGQNLLYLLRFAWKMKVATVCDTVVCHADKIFISRFVSFEAAGLYQLGSSLAFVLRDFVSHFVLALLPVVTEIAAEGKPERLLAANFRASRMFIILCTPSFFFPAAAAPLIIHAWIGQLVEETSLSFSLLCIAFYANSTMLASMKVGEACHMPQLQMRSAIVGVILNLTLNLLLVVKFGFVGVLIASIFSLSIASLIYARLITRFLGAQTIPFLWAVFAKPILAATVPALALVMICDLDSIAAASRYHSLAWLALSAPLFLFVYLFSLFLTRHIQISELREVWKLLFSKKVFPTP